MRSLLVTFEPNILSAFIFSGGSRAGGEGDGIQNCPLGFLIPKATSSVAWMNKCLIKTWASIGFHFVF